MNEMKRVMRKVFALLVVCVLLFALAACGRQNGTQDNDTQGNDTQEEEIREEETARTGEADVYHIIGISVYSETDPLLSMFVDYYKNYIAQSFPVEFLVSESLTSAEDEIDFIEEVKEQGGEGIISFYGQNLEQVVDACADNEMYYVLGAASISDDEFNAVKDNEWFLGVIGPEEDEEFNSGKEMAEAFISQGATSFLIASGGAEGGENYMHVTRAEGMLTALQDELGLSFDVSLEDLAQVSEVTTVETGKDDVTLVISPGYLDVDEGQENLAKAFEEGDYDAMMAVAGVNSVEDMIKDEIKSSGSEMYVGVIDCFSEDNYDAVEKKDAAGYPLINYVKGRYASMVAPAFVAVFNAMEGDADVVKPDGEAFRLYQTYWTADGEKEFVELYSLTVSIYENAYSSSDLMEVIRTYNPDASYDQFAKLTEATDIESVEARLDSET